MAREKLNELLDNESFEELKTFAEASEGNFKKVQEVIAERALIAVELGNRLADAKETAAVHAAVEKETRKDLNTLKDQTARMVEIVAASEYFEPSYGDLPEGVPLGNLVEVTSYEPKTREWLEARFDTIGGSDVGTLVVNEYGEAIKYWDKSALKRLIESKTQPVTDKQVNFQDYSIETHKAGPLYRGSVWEDLSRELFAVENPEYTVYNTKSQYAHKDRIFQQVNFDGILSDRIDGVPNGILELKTGTYVSDWDSGIPLNYRAQTLYYLNASGFDYAIIGVLINDGELFLHHLHKDDAVAPGKYDKSMDDYIHEKLLPWFEEVKKLREN